jgi:hypothetical protein
MLLAEVNNTKYEGSRSSSSSSGPQRKLEQRQHLPGLLAWGEEGGDKCPGSSNSSSGGKSISSSSEKAAVPAAAAVAQLINTSRASCLG